MGTLGQLRYRVANVLTAMARTAFRWERGTLRRLTGRWDVVVRACRFGHCCARESAKRWFTPVVPVSLRSPFRRGGLVAWLSWVLCGAKYMLT